MVILRVNTWPIDFSGQSESEGSIIREETAEIHGTQSTATTPSNQEENVQCARHITGHQVHREERVQLEKV